MKNTLLILPVIAVIITACDPVSERECGVFNHPEFALWQPDSLGEQLQIMSEDGSIINFARQPVVFNEPFLGADGASNDEDVLCELTATVRLQAVDNSIAIVSTYIQLEQLLVPDDLESLLVNHTVEAPVGTELAGGFGADISVANVRSIFDADRVIYLEPDVLTEELGGQSYVDVIRINAIDLTPGVDSVEAESIDVVQQIVMAQNFGVIAFTDDEGQEFVRIPDQ